MSPSADYRVDILNGSAGLITPANPLPVTVTGAIALGEVEVKNDTGNPVPVAGTVALDAATLAALETINALIGNFPADYPSTAVLAKVEAVRALLAGTLAVAGSVAVSNFPASTEISNDAGNPVPVSGTVTVLNPGTGGLTDAELRASPVDVALPGLPGLEINQVSVGTSEVPVPAVPLTGRASISVKALAANGAEVYVRRVTVSTTTGWELSAGDSIDIDADDTVQVMAVSLSGTQRVCYAEI